jgi:hypothetical protein
MNQPIPTTSAEFDSSVLIERPDGFYWQAIDGGPEHGPFATLIEAARDMEAFDAEREGDEFEALREVEDVLGVPDFVDRETGELADDEHTRIEDDH